MPASKQPLLFISYERSFSVIAVVGILATWHAVLDKHSNEVLFK